LDVLEGFAFRLIEGADIEFEKSVVFILRHEFVLGRN
jgi:hypothetical protein